MSIKQLSILALAFFMFLSQLSCGDESAAKILELREKYGGKSKRIPGLSGSRTEKFAEVLPYAPQIPELKSINAGGQNLTKDTIVMIGKIKQLEKFDSDNTLLNSSDFKPLGELQKLKVLEISNTPSLDDEIFPTLAKLKELETIDIHGTKIEGKKLHLLVDNKNIKKLKLNDCLITDEAIPAMLKMPQLQELILTDTKISPEGQEQLMALVNLTRYAGPGVPLEKCKELARLAIAARQKARAAGLPAGPDNLAPFYDTIQER